MGELPRSMQLVVDRTLVGTIAPGTRVTAVGIYSIYQVRCGPTTFTRLLSLEASHLSVKNG